MNRPIIQKMPPWRDPDYIDWIKTQPCAVTGRYGTQRNPIDPHHLIGHGWSGTGTRSPDFLAMPLRRDEHERLHHGWQDWEAKHGSQYRFAARTLERAFVEGVLTVNRERLTELLEESGYVR